MHAFLCARTRIVPPFPLLVTVINHAQIVTLAATGTDIEKTKDGPFHKDFAVDFIS